MRKVMAKDRKTFIKNNKMSLISAIATSVTSAFVGCLMLTQIAIAAEYVLPISKARQHAEDIRHFIPDRQIKFLNAGDKEFIALFKEQTAGLTKGTAIIVPDIEQPIHKQAAISGLYDKLTNYGWNSLLLTMPDDLSQIIDKEDSAKDPATDDNATDNVEVGTVDEEPATDEQPKSDAESTTETAEQTNPNLQLKSFYIDPIFSPEGSKKISTEIQLRLDAAWQLASGSPGYYLVICQGKSCAWITEIIANNRQFMPDALIMISAFMPQQDANQQLAERVANSDYAILDLYQDADNSWVLANVNIRKILSRKQFKVEYRQRKLHVGTNYYGQQSRILKEIYGFLSSVGM